MADSNARPHVPTLGETKQGSIWPNPEALKAAFPWSGPEAFKAAFPRLDEQLKAVRAQLNPEAFKATSLRLDEALKAIRAQLNPEVLKLVSRSLNPEALKLQAVSQPVRRCQHCGHALYIHLPDDTLEPCTRSNRLNCGHNAEGRLIGNLECINKRKAAKARRTYARRKARKLAGNTAPVLYVIDGKARPQ
jgi:hypothetical protein